jgi:hypothetical protein
MWFKPVALTCLAIGLSSPALAQQALDPLNLQEIAIAKSALLGSVTVRQSLGSQPYYTIINVERHNEPKGTTSSGRRADVILYNYTTNETISAVVSVAGGSPRIDAMRVTKDPPPPLGADETEAARQMALANPAVQTRLLGAGVAASDPSLIVTHLFGRTDDTRDPCAKNRCVLLFFNTPAQFLFPAVVDLTERKVRVIDAPER